MGPLSPVPEAFPRRRWPGAVRWMVAVLLAVVLVVAGCGGGDEDDSTGGEDGTGSATATSEATGGSGSAGDGSAAGDSTSEPGSGGTDSPGQDTGSGSGSSGDGSSGSGSSGDDPDGTATGGPATTGTEEPTPTSPPVPTEPLTGLPLEDPSIMNRPALAVKIGNSSLGQPQTGVNQADMLIEVRVEGITRLITVFHSQGADPVGPARSARSSDPDILANFGQPVYGHSGANPGVLGEMRDGEAAGKLVELRWDDLPREYWRVKDRVAPFNLYTSTSAIWNAAPSSLEAPEPLFEYRREGESLPSGAQEVPGVEVRYLGSGNGVGVLVHFAWDEEAQGWARWQDNNPHMDLPRNPDGTPNPDVDPVQVAPANVVLLQTDYTSSSFCPACPQAITVNPEGGVALVLTDGHLIRGRWTRPTAADPWRVTDTDGNPVRLTPGQTFIGLPGGDILVMHEDFAEDLLDG